MYAKRLETSLWCFRILLQLLTDQASQLCFPSKVTLVIALKYPQHPKFTLPTRWPSQFACLAKRGQNHFSFPLLEQRKVAPQRLSWGLLSRKLFAYCRQFFLAYCLGALEMKAWCERSWKSVMSHPYVQVWLLHRKSMVRIVYTRVHRGRLFALPESEVVESLYILLQLSIM